MIRAIAFAETKDVTSVIRRHNLRDIVSRGPIRQFILSGTRSSNEFKFSLALRSVVQPERAGFRTWPSEPGAESRRIGTVDRPRSSELEGAVSDSGRWFTVAGVLWKVGLRDFGAHSDEPVLIRTVTA
jgi:hypothetical protein